MLYSCVVSKFVDQVTLGSFFGREKLSFIYLFVYKTFFLIL